MMRARIAIGQTDYEWPRKRIGRYAEGVRIGQWLIVEVVRVDDKTHVRTKCTLCGYYDRHPLAQHTKRMSKVCIGCEDKITRAEVIALWAACDDDGVLPEDRCLVCRKVLPLNRFGQQQLCGPFCKRRHDCAAYAKKRKSLQEAK